MLLNDLQVELQQIKNLELTRNIKELRFLTPVQGMDKTGQQYTVFSSNNYLGLTHAPEVISASQRAAAFGTGSTGSRLTTGSSFESGELERALAKFKHAEKALIFNTGYMTNLGVLYGLVKPRDTIFSDSLNHASIIDGCRITRAQVKIYPHSDMAALETLLKQDRNTGHKFVVTDGVFSMDGDIAKLPELVQLKEKYGFCLIVDDAHAVGVLGEDGSGTASHFGLLGKIDLQIGTLSKALASEGGYVAGNSIYIDYLMNKSRPFIFSTAISPGAYAAALAALQLLEEERESYLYKLRENTQYIRCLFKEAKIPVLAGITPIIPLVLGDARRTVEVAAQLAKAGFLVSAIRPPTVEQGKSRLRLTVSAAHSFEDLKKVTEALVSLI